MINQIEVKNLGPVKEWKADLKELNFFIGPNGSGKSYVSMTLYSMLNAISRGDGDIEKKLQYVFQEKNLKRLIRWGEREAKVIIKIKDSEIKLSIHNKKKVSFKSNLIESLSADTINFISIPDVLNVYSAINIFTQEHKGSFGVSETVTDFLTRILYLEYPERAKEWNELLKELEDKINARFSIKEGKIIALFKGERVNIERVASGLKTFSLIYLALKQGLIIPGGILFLEEPEEHLHPEWQVVMGELLVDLALRGIQILISTHSDYLLKKVNNILQMRPEIKENIRAYLFKADGIPEKLEIDERGIDLLPLLTTFYHLYEEEQELL